jgi:RHS repeat-associated protein
MVRFQIFIPSSGGTQRMYGYDALMRLNTLTVTDPGGNPLLDYAYTYDTTGNIVTKATEHGEYGYDYDAMSRLISADHPVSDDESYTYDAVGNRLTAADVSGTWNYNANNELLGFADVVYDYDANGNLTEIRIAGSVVWTYVYDAADRLVHVEDGTGSISADYYYDPFGRRLWKDVGGTRTYFFYSDEGLIGEYDASGNEIKTYGYKPDSTWTTDPLWLKQDRQYYFYQNDHLGTPQKLVGVNGAVVWSATYNAFGRAKIDPLLTVANNLRFPGQYYDQETGLHYNWHRYYDPEIGRYLTADPIGFNGGDLNVYGYVRNNPVNGEDIDGLKNDEFDCKKCLEWLRKECQDMGWVNCSARNENITATSIQTMKEGKDELSSFSGYFFVEYVAML